MEFQQRQQQQQQQLPVAPNAGIPHRKPVGGSTYSPAHQIWSAAAISAEQLTQIIQATPPIINSVPSKPISPLPPDWTFSYTPEGRIYYINTMDHTSSWTFPPESEGYQNQKDNQDIRSFKLHSTMPEATRTITEPFSFSPAVESLEWESSAPTAFSTGHQNQRQTFPLNISDSSHILAHQFETGMLIGKEGTKKAIELSKTGLHLGIEGTKKGIELGKAGKAMAVKTAKEHKQTVRTVLNITDCFLYCFTGYRFGGARVLGHSLDDPQPNRQVRDNKGRNNEHEATQTGKRQSEDGQLKGVQERTGTTGVEKIAAEQAGQLSNTTDGQAPGTRTTQPVKWALGAPPTATETSNTHLYTKNAKDVQQPIVHLKPKVQTNQSTIDAWLLKQSAQATNASRPPFPTQKPARTQTVSQITQIESPSNTVIQPRRHSTHGTGIKLDHNGPETQVQEPAKPTDFAHGNVEPTVWSQGVEAIKYAARDVVVGAIEYQAQQQVNNLLGLGNILPGPQPSGPLQPNDNGVNTNVNVVDVPKGNSNQNTDSINMPLSNPVQTVFVGGQSDPNATANVLPPVPAMNTIYGADCPMIPNIVSMPDCQYYDLRYTRPNFVEGNILPVISVYPGDAGGELGNKDGMVPLDVNGEEEGMRQLELEMEGEEVEVINRNFDEVDLVEKAQGGGVNELEVADSEIDGGIVENQTIESDGEEGYYEDVDDNADNGFDFFGGDDDY
jgi:WW domain